MAISLAALALGGWLIRDANQLQALYEQQEQNASRAHAEQSRIAIDACRVLPPRERFQCVRQEVEIYRQAQHDDADLEAQMVTSAWTGYMGVAAIGGTAFGIIGIFLVLATFRENRRSADAAHDANRPWIKVSLPEGGVRGWRFENEIPTFLIKIMLKNVGNSPALSVSYTVSMAYGGSVRAAVDAVVAKYRDGTIGWEIANLFPQDEFERQTESEHAGEPPGTCRASFYIVAAYKWPGSKELRFTARAWDIVDRRLSDEGREARLVHFPNVPFGASLYLATPEEFIGFAT